MLLLQREGTHEERLPKTTLLGKRGVGTTTRPGPVVPKLTSNLQFPDEINSTTSEYNFPISKILPTSKILPISKTPKITKTSKISANSKESQFHDTLPESKDFKDICKPQDTENALGSSESTHNRPQPTKTRKASKKPSKKFKNPQIPHQKANLLEETPEFKDPHVPESISIASEIASDLPIITPEISIDLRRQHE
jgi:hypothetical protein